MTHIVITEGDNDFRVHMQEPLENAVEYDLAIFPVNTVFTRQMAALVAAEYSHRNGIPINMEGLTQSTVDALRHAERDHGLLVTYRIKIGDKVA